MAKKKPQRTCIGCRQPSVKRELIRIVRTPEGTIAIDRTGKRSGRGAYLCADPQCWRVALDERRIGRALRMTPSSEDLACLEDFVSQLIENESEAGKTEAA